MGRGYLQNISRMSGDKLWSRCEQVEPVKQVEPNWPCSHGLPQLQDINKFIGGILLVKQASDHEPHLSGGSEISPWHVCRRAIILSDSSRVAMMQQLHQEISALTFGVGETPGLHSVGNLYISCLSGRGSCSGSEVPLTSDGVGNCASYRQGCLSVNNCFYPCKSLLSSHANYHALLTNQLQHHCQCLSRKHSLIQES